MTLARRIFGLWSTGERYFTISHDIIICNPIVILSCDILKEIRWICCLFKRFNNNDNNNLRSLPSSLHFISIFLLKKNPTMLWKHLTIARNFFKIVEIKISLCVDCSAAEIIFLLINKSAVGLFTGILTEKRNEDRARNERYDLFFPRLISGLLFGAPSAINHGNTATLGSAPHSTVCKPVRNKAIRRRFATTSNYPDTICEQYIPDPRAT